MLARRVPLLIFTIVFSVAAWSQTNTAAGAGTYPAQPQPNSTANLGIRPEVLPWDTGEASLHLLAKKLKNTGRIMHLTAHPDDEDGALLTYLARGQGRQVLLMSLTRGEGGQNRTGSNLWDELGVLRTLELLESTRYYGTELRFSRVADFGFSKSADETFQKWGGHQVPLRDIVYVIREWKPDVLFTRFSGTPRDGHGHHQASAILAPEAVKCAADPNCFPDQLKGDHALTPWQVLKLYMGNQGGEYTVRYDVSQIDPDTKLSYTQMALEGFKHQASQLSGNFTPPSGPNWRSYKLISTTIPNYKADKEQDFFDGIDTSILGLKAYADDSERRNLQNELFRLQSEILIAASISPQSSSSAFLQVGQDVGALIKRHKSWLQIGRREFESSNVIGARLMQTYRDASAAAYIYSGLTASASGVGPVIEPATTSLAKVSITNSGKSPTNYSASVQEKAVDILPNLPVKKGTALPSQQKSEQIPFGVPDTLTRQHWVRKDPERDTAYDVIPPTSITSALQDPPVQVFIGYTLNGTDGEFRVPLTYRGTEVAVENPVSVLFEHVSQVKPRSENRFETAVTIKSLRDLSAEVTIEAPAGWSVTPKAKKVLLRPNAPTRVTFDLRSQSEASGRSELKAVVSAEGKQYRAAYSPIGRPDLQTFYYYQPAIQRVSIVDVNVPKNLRVGYIPGAGDDIFPVLQQLGLNAKQISNDELAKGDLHQYDTLVVGIRGYDERPEIRANNQRLLDFVNDGGTLLVQNQKAEDVFNSGHFTPYPATLGRQRVSVEEAPVTVLSPNDSVFNAPNKITHADFDGWVQERGINFMSDWDAKYEPLLACNDPGEQPLKGGLLRAKYGKGTYIYTGYAFFRQLPAGVPGAVRLYVNLLNAGHEGK